ncbi:MAG: hypothetical protein CBARDMAM_5592 [uncultured Caballeronia sp.]|nr:MAG: hypothetical protein CBARDMAM_5592 [uncultured Caballeronia sp.]
MATKKNKPDPRESWTPLYAEMITCHAYRVLSGPSKHLLWDLKSMCNGKNNGSIGAPLSAMKARFGWTSSSVLSRSLYELRTMGFIALMKQGGLREGTRVCSLYRFTDLPVYEDKQTGRQAVGQTFDYDNTPFNSQAEARALLEVRVAEYQDEERKRQGKKSPVLTENQTGSLREPMRSIFRSPQEQGATFSGSRREQGICLVG